MSDSGNSPVGISLHVETDASCHQARGRRDERGAWMAPGGAGVVLRDSSMEPVATYAIALGWVPSALHAEYMALHLGLQKALERGARSVRVRSDCLVMVRHLAGTWPMSNLEFEDLSTPIRHLREFRFERFELLWARSTHATHRRDGVLSADALAKVASGVLRPARLPAGVVMESLRGER